MARGGARRRWRGRGRRRRGRSLSRRRRGAGHRGGGRFLCLFPFFLLSLLALLFLLLFFPLVSRVVRQRQRDRVPPAACHAHDAPPVRASGERHRDRSVTVTLVARAQAPERAPPPREEPAIACERGGVRASSRGLDDGDAVEGADALGGEAGGARAVAEAEPGEEKKVFFVSVSARFESLEKLFVFPFRSPRPLAREKKARNGGDAHLPYSPRPHTYTPPPPDSARECHPPAAMSAAPPSGRPRTSAGCVSYVVEPVPSCPKSLMPQARTPPPSSSTSVWKAPQASLAARGREGGRAGARGEGEGEEQGEAGEGEKNGGDDGEAPPVLPAPAPPLAPPPPDDDDDDDEESGTGLGALLITTEKSPHGSPQVQTSPSSVSAAECVPPAATCLSRRWGRQRTGVETSLPVDSGSEPHWEYSLPPCFVSGRQFFINYWEEKNEERKSGRVSVDPR